MFSVYGSSGRLFRGTLEQLRQVGPVHAVDRTRSIEQVARDGRGGGALPDLNRPPPFADTTPGGALAAAYAPQLPAAGQRWSEAPVESVMSRHVISVVDTDTVAQAWQALEFYGFAQAPVVGSNAALVGLVTFGHLLRFSQLPKRGSKPAPDALAFLDHTVHSIMLTPVPSVAPGAPLRSAAAVLLESGLAGLPVADDSGVLVGFVSRSDILRAVLHDTPLDMWS